MAPLIVYIRGGGDLGSGIALRLVRAGIHVLIAELPQPLVVRRFVSFAETVYRGSFTVEDVTARFASGPDQALEWLEQGILPVLIDPDASAFRLLQARSAGRSPSVLVDARMFKQPPDYTLRSADLVIGLGPGFVAGENCHAVIETNRGHRLGRVIWQGIAQADTGIPEKMMNVDVERVLRSPADGFFQTHAEIGDLVEKGQLIASVADHPIKSPFKGTLRGLLHSGLQVKRGLKIGDVDPRLDPAACYLVSEKSLAIAGGVLEAILARPRLRPCLWE